MHTLKSLLFDQGFAVIFPILAGLIRWWVIRPSDRPIVVICLFYLVNELVRRLLLGAGYTGYASYNIGALITALLYLWLFYCWGIFKPGSHAWRIIAAGYLCIWVFDNLFWSSIHSFTLVFRLCMVLSLIVFSLSHINKLILSEKKNLYTSGRFIITVAILIYNIYRIMLDSFNQANFSDDFLVRLGNAHRYMVLGLYLFFTIGILCLPKKKTFFLPS